MNFIEAVKKTIEGHNVVRKENRTIEVNGESHSATIVLRIGLDEYGKECKDVHQDVFIFEKIIIDKEPNEDWSRMLICIDDVMATDWEIEKGLKYYE